MEFENEKKHDERNYMIKKQIMDIWFHMKKN